MTYSQGHRKHHEFVCCHGQTLRMTVVSEMRGDCGIKDLATVLNARLASLMGADRLLGKNLASNPHSETDEHAEC